MFNLKFRIFSTLFLICLLFVVPACRDKYSECTDSDYNNCDTEYPTTGTIRARISVLPESPEVILRIFEGPFEDGVLVLTDTIIKLRYVDYLLEVEKWYSFTATYTTSPFATIAVDGARIKRIRYRACELTCYELVEPEVNLRAD